MNGSTSRIDFPRSDIRWVTGKEKSQGAFQLESVLRWRADDAASPTLFALGAAVLAGNMYAEGNLCQLPRYMFQVAAGVSEHVIFRTDIEPSWARFLGRLRGRSASADTLRTCGPTFDSLDINLHMEPAKSLQDYEELAAHYSLRNQFTCVIAFDLPTAEKIELEFPVKHLNLLPGRKMWQLETGPVLFCGQGDLSALGGVVLPSLLPYFVHANRFDSADFSPDFPFAKGMSARSSTARNGKMRCQVRLFVGDV